VATLLIKLVTAPRKATQSATTVAVKVTSLVNARLLPNQNPATDVVKKVTFPVTAPTKNLARAVVAVDGAVVVVVAVAAILVATLVVVAAKNVTSAAKLVTLHATALRAVVDMAVEEATGADTATEEGAVVAARHATPAAASATCLVTVPKARSATTVSLK
jgi:putative intracellular protease/amidase